MCVATEAFSGAEGIDPSKHALNMISSPCLRGQKQHKKLVFSSLDAPGAAKPCLHVEIPEIKLILEQ